MRVSSPDEEEAMRALAVRLATVSDLSDKSVGHPEFISWKKATRDAFDQYLPGSVYTTRFAGIFFDKPPLASNSDICMGSDFMNGLTSARKCLEGAIEYIAQFGLSHPDRK
jgi:hypothetical protein